MSTEKYIGEAQIKDNLKSRFRLMIAPEAIKTEHIADKQITPEKLSPRVAQEVVRPLYYDLQNQINTLGAEGTAISTQFGDNDNVTVSQKALTQAFNRVWSKLSEITGEVLQGISLVCSPDYYVGERGASVRITANSVAANGIFEHIVFKINGVVIKEATNVASLSYNTEIMETSVVECTAKILGVEYNEQKIITHYGSFWLGGGSSYSDVMKFGNLRSISNGLKGSYDVTVNEGQNIMVVVGDALAAEFVRADMNGMEIQFTESSAVVNNNTYKVFTSENTYQSGTYNIDINS